MSTVALKPLFVSSLLLRSGQIERAKSRLKFDPKKRSEELRGLAPLKIASPEQAERRELAAVLSETPRADLERLINLNDCMNINYLEKGMMAARSVGRVLVRDLTGDLIAYGTGFKISNQLLMTNNHVLESSDTAAKSQIEFNYQLDIQGRPEESEIFGLRPDTFFFTSVDLDFTVVAIEARSSRGAEVSVFGALPLIGQRGKVLEGEYVTCIEHPSADYKQVALRENQVVQTQENTIWYHTDTAKASSGSPMFNDSWQVVALHHAGAPKEDAQGNILTVDDQIWKPEMGEEKIQWIANEGMRISSIVAQLKASCGNNPLIQQAIPDLASRVIETGAPSTGRTVSFPQRLVAGNAPLPAVEARTNGAQPVSIAGVEPVEITVPLNLKVSLGRAVPAELEKAKVPKATGYDENFLRTRIPVPALNRTQIRDVAQLENSLTIPYTHFSVCLSKAHRMAYFVAWNIDGEQLKPYSRKGLKFEFDSRVSEEFQIGDELYAGNKLDRGHLARRADLTYGPKAEAMQANRDSFKFTNITPQHQAFNQSDKHGLWGELENALLDEISVENLRVSLMAGPLFKNTDIEYRGIRIPADFWKVLVYVDEEDHQLKAKAFVLTQQNLLGDLEAFALDPFRLYQVPISKLEELTGFSFEAVRDFDTFTGTAGEALRLKTTEAGLPAQAVREIASRKDLFGPAA